MPKRLHPSVRCYEEGCDSTGSILLEINPDNGPITEACPSCTGERVRQSREIMADALAHYNAAMDPSGASVISYAGTALGVVHEDGDAWTGTVGGPGVYTTTIPAIAYTPGPDGMNIYQQRFETFDEAARAVINTARAQSLIG